MQIIYTCRHVAWELEDKPGVHKIRPKVITNKKTTPVSNIRMLNVTWLGNFTVSRQRNRQPQRKFLFRGETRNWLHLLSLPNQPCNMAKPIRLRILLIPSFIFEWGIADLLISKVGCQTANYWVFVRMVYALYFRCGTVGYLNLFNFIGTPY